MKKKWIVVIVMTCINFIVQMLIRIIPSAAEHYRSYIYPFWVMLGRITSLVNVSVIEWLLYFFIIGVVVYWILVFKGKFGESIKHTLPTIALHLCIFVNVLFGIYTLTCGINYQALSFAEQNKIQLEDYDLKELEKTAFFLTEELQKIEAQVNRNTDGIMQISAEINEKARKQFDNMEEYKGLSGVTLRPKPVMVSQILSYMQISGIYSPFTIEANYNAHMIPYNIPFTICHELAHTKGIMREEEANFVAYLTCIKSEDIEFRYSGVLMGWIYVSNAVARYDRQMYEKIYSMLSEDVKADLRANSAFWKKYDGKIGEISESINDNYLKVNSQEDGIKSYGRMVDYIVNYHQSVIE